MSPPCRSVFMNAAPAGTVPADAIVRVEPAGGRIERFDFGPDVMVSEPLPAGPAHVLTMGLDGKRRRSFLAIFAAVAIADGPVATAWLDRPLPATFHGLWQPQG